jgi:hypothetical protein
MTAEIRQRPKIYVPISLLSATRKLFEKLILRTIQKHSEERTHQMQVSLDFEQITMTFECMRLADHVTPNFSSNISTAAAFLDIEKVSRKTRHSGLLYKLSEL